MRLGVLGNCQRTGLAASLRQLCPDATVTAVALDARPGRGATDASAAALAACDIVFSQHVARAEFGELRSEVLRPRVRRFVPFPTISFAGFHPDMVRLRDAMGREFDGPMGAGHSALAAAAFLEGLTEERARGLFNAYVYGRLGYLDDHPAELRRLAARFAEDGYDFAAALPAGPAPFMHTSNHPAIGLLFAVAGQALRLAGIAPRDAPPPPDPLASGPRWAVYPEIARRIGCPPGDFIAGQRRMQLEEFIAACFAAYRARRPGGTHPAVARARDFIREQVLGLRPAAADRPVTAAEARQAYLHILGRAPQEATLARVLRRGMTAGQLRRFLLRSQEFARNYARMNAAEAPEAGIAA